MLKCVSLTAVCLLTVCLATVHAEDKKDTPAVLKHKMTTLDGKEQDLSEYAGKVVVIVNVASKCGATPQYEPLQDLYSKYKDKGLVVLGFPCNQFGRQEPGTAEEIQTFCKTNYGVNFPMFAKIDVNGDEAAPLYKHLTSEAGFAKDPGKVKWNFEKFVIGKDGNVVARLRTRTQPDDAKVIKLIETELAK